jgi:ribosomal silencing factor RsfS
MNWRHYINTIKKTLQRNGFNHLADEVLMAEVNAGKNANAILKEVISKLAQFRTSEQEAYGYIVSEAEALIRFAKTYGIEPSN